MKLHGSATTTHAVRAAKQRSRATVKESAAQSRLDPKTVAKRKKRLRPHSGQGSHRRAFRKHTLLPLEDCLDALQATFPHLTRSSLHRGYLRHCISRLPEIDSKKSVHGNPTGCQDIAHCRQAFPAGSHRKKAPHWAIRPGLLDRPATALLYPQRIGAVAQMGERCNRTAEVRGSIPLGSTKIR